MDSSIIQFEELRIDPEALRQELSSPEARRNARLPFPVSLEIRRQQILRLEENVGILRRKQEEFNRKMEDYIGSLQKLIASLRRGMERGAPAAETAEASVEPAVVADPTLGGTYVRCVGCGSEREFPDVNVLVALEPEEFMTRPTEVIVQRDGQLRKGFFRCPRCGEYNLTIRPR